MQDILQAFACRTSVEWGRAGQSGAEGVEERGSWAVCEASMGAKPGSNGILDHHRHALCPLASTI